MCSMTLHANGRFHLLVSWLHGEALPGVLGFREKGYLFSGIWQKGHLFSGIWGVLGVLGSRGLRKNILGSWGERSFFFQGAGSKDPPPPPWWGLHGQKRP